MVFATALRRVNGATGMAEDVVQQVFNLLVRKAKSLSGRGCPAGWLYRQTCFLAANEMRATSRRIKRERMAMEMMEPNEAGLSEEVVRELDQAMLGLPEKTRNVLVLRFFEGLNYREIGKKFELSEDGSRKQVNRALERLREMLQRRGVTTSCSSLVLGLPNLGIKNISATLNGKIVASGMAQSVGGISLGVHLAAFAAGAVAVSAVMVGVQSLQASVSRGDRAERSPSNTGHRVVREREAAQGIHSREDMWSQLERLSELPQNAATDLQINALLMNIPNGEIEDFSKESRDVLSEPAHKLACDALFWRWVAENPGEASMASLRVGRGDFFYRASMSQWARHDPEAAGNWLRQNWEEVERFGLKWYGGKLVDKFAMTVIDSYESRDGIESALRQMSGYPEEVQMQILANLTGGVLRSMRVGSADRLYEYLRPFSESDRHKEMLRRVMKSWGEDDPAGMLEHLALKSREEQYRTQLYLLCDLHPSGQKQENAAGQVTVLSDGKPYATITKREERAYQLGVEAGYGRSQILEAMARELMVHQNGRIEESEWFFRNRDSSDLDEVRRRFEANHLKYVGISDPRYFGKSVFHASLMTALLLENEKIQASLIEKVFAIYQGLDSEGAREWAAASFVPDGIKVRLQSLDGK